MSIRNFAVTATAAAIATLTLATPAVIANADDVTIKIETSKSSDENQKPATEPFTGQRPTVDVAILLDTSNSMDGLINQARSQLWNIVQEFAKAKKAGKTPQLRVAVLQYGNSNLPATEDYIGQVVPLTDDLDKVSEGLFALKTNGGDEYCGSVIKEAIKRLDWSGEPGGYKAIFIAGNEPFDQGSVDYRKMCEKAIGRGVVVNTIHCGDRDSGITGHWKDGADLAEGKFMNIDQDQRVVHIKAPQDDVIIRLNAELNQTYLWYGSSRQRDRYEANQVKQDSNAGEMGGLSKRASIKSSSLYSNVGRDLVDTFESDEAAIAKLETEVLPERLRDLSAEQRVDEIKKLANRRRELKNELAKISGERDTYVQAERAKLDTDSPETFGDAFVGAVGEQLLKSGFEIK